MPILTLRSVGVSYLVEGVVASGLEPRELLGALTETYGLAVAPLSTPRTLEPMDPATEPGIDAIIVDRRAVPWETLRTWLETYVTTNGCGYVSWADDARDPTVATLHFHRV